MITGKRDVNYKIHEVGKIKRRSDGGVENHERFRCGGGGGGRRGCPINECFNNQNKVMDEKYRKECKRSRD